MQRSLPIGNFFSILRSILQLFARSVVASVFTQSFKVPPSRRGVTYSFVALLYALSYIWLRKQGESSRDPCNRRLENLGEFRADARDGHPASMGRHRIPGDKAITVYFLLFFYAKFMPSTALCPRQRQYFPCDRREKAITRLSCFPAAESALRIYITSLLIFDSL